MLTNKTIEMKQHSYAVIKNAFDLLYYYQKKAYFCITLR